MPKPTYMAKAIMPRPVMTNRGPIQYIPFPQHSTHLSTAASEQQLIDNNFEMFVRTHDFSVEADFCDCDDSAVVSGNSSCFIIIS